MQTVINLRIFIACFLATNLLTSNTFAATAPAEALRQLAEGKSVDLIVEYDDAAIEKTAVSMRSKTVNRTDDENISRYKVREYRALKNKLDQSIARSDIQHIKDYSHMPISFKRFTSKAALNAFLAKTGVKAVHVNERLRYVLAESLPLIGQPTVVNAGANNAAYLGTGSTVAVIDGAIDISNAALGACSAPNLPASCHVVASSSFATAPETNSSHGTNVSAIVLGVAPGSKVAALNVFDTGGGASVSDIISAINWAISNRANYNIVAINMSLGGDTKFTSTCNGDWSATPINQARNAGISVAVASGNSLFIDGLSSPACAPSAISVGAVYDNNIGAVTWNTAPNCTDSTTAADQVTCFSNSASYLTLLAPGAFINAGGINFGGTSQAAPHVAGALAVLRAAFPNETLTQTQARLTSNGVVVTDARNNITKPRLNLLAAARPANDNFANRFNLTGAFGNATGVSLLASKEAGEPNHANNVGGSSVWWRWTAPSGGQVSLNTTGSGFDTLLGVYTGASIGALSQKAANDNNASLVTSSLVFQAVAGTQYQFAVDGVAAAADNVSLNWSINTTAQANLSSSVSGPTSVVSGSSNNYTLTASNAGPQSASNVVVTLTIPASASFVSVPGCVLNGNVASCAVGTLVNGSSQSFIIQLIWNSVAAGAAISSGVSSDVPDSTSSNNTSSIQITQNTTGGNNNADIPTLPEWGMLLMAFSMLLIGWRTRLRTRN
jgi:uncharacterized repeat protein (TIGR01451 family)